MSKCVLICFHHVNNSSFMFIFFFGSFKMSFMYILYRAFFFSYDYFTIIFFSLFLLFHQFMGYCSCFRKEQFCASYHTASWNVLLWNLLCIMIECLRFTWTQTMKYFNCIKLLILFFTAISKMDVEFSILQM